MLSYLVDLVGDVLFFLSFLFDALEYVIYQLANHSALFLLGDSNLLI